jgi:hypothetical protein
MADARADVALDQLDEFVAEREAELGLVPATGLEPAAAGNPIGEFGCF